MFHSISYYLPLGKELKRKDFITKKRIFQSLSFPKYSPYTKRLMGKCNYYKFVVHHSLIEKLEDEIREKREKKKLKIKRKALEYDDIDDINKRFRKMEKAVKLIKGKFNNSIRFIFKKVFQFSIEMGNIELIKTLIEKYGKYVGLIDEISIREKDKEVMKYLKFKGLEKQIKSED